MSDLRVRHAPPARVRRPSIVGFLVTLAAVALVVHAVSAGAIVAPGTLLAGLGRTGEFAAEAFPPSLDRIGAISWSMLETFEIALLGTALGVILSIPLAVLAARNTAPHPVVYGATRGIIAFLRSVPDLVWGLIASLYIGNVALLVLNLPLVGLWVRLLQVP